MILSAGEPVNLSNPGLRGHLSAPAVATVWAAGPEHLDSAGAASRLDTDRLNEARRMERQGCYSEIRNPGHIHSFEAQTYYSGWARRT